ncbi:hypothetical protein [Rickettsia felis]|uniref:hypothetical protein n=1 Tax=Rickettsia felis TaxID=42862 RepID=UPI000573A508|nr:hypothetical protein [Rickettsia felis]KHO02694.1 hypothetical protein JS55_05585 [Rickettsia felis str. LSU]
MHNIFLVINLSNKELVESAYLIHLYKNLDWKLDVIPFVNYKQVKDISSYIEDILTEIDVGIIGARMYNDLGITSARIEQVMEHMKLRIQYSKLNKDNFEQYKTKLDAIKFAKPGAYTETHKEILEQISINNYIDTVVINKKELEIFKADIMPHQPSSSNINTEDYNDKAAISLTGETE